MYFSKVLSIISLAAAASAVSVSYDTGYDDANRSLTSVACSDGSNGLIPKGYPTQGSLPDFPFIGGAAVVAGWNDPDVSPTDSFGEEREREREADQPTRGPKIQCGSCWQLTYNGKSINVLAIDHTDNGFNLALGAMNALTNNQAEFLGRIEATATQVAASVCGI